MGRRKKVEIDPDMVEQTVPKPATKTVDAKHVITYNEPVTVPVAETDAETEPDEVEDDEEDGFVKPKVPSLRTRLRAKLEKVGITDTEQMRLRIDRLPNYEKNGQAGVQAEKEHIYTVSCTEEFFTSDEYLDFIRVKGGPGTYWLTLRYRNSIIQSWQERIGGASPLDQPALDGVPMAMNSTVDPSAMMDAFMRQFEKFQKIQSAMMPPWMKQMNPGEWVQPNSQPAQVNTTESALMTLLNSDDELLNQATGKLRKLLRGGDGAAAEEKGPWDAIVALANSPIVSQMFSTMMQRIGTPAEQVQNSQPPPQHQPPPDVMMLQRLSEILVETMKLNGDVAPVLRAIDGLVTFFPQHQFTAENLMNADTQQLLATLPQMYPPAAEVVGLPHAAEWLERLKLAYFDEGDAPEV